LKKNPNFTGIHVFVLQLSTVVRRQNSAGVTWT